MSHKVFVGNIPFETTQSDLEALFADIGEVVEIFIPADRATGRPRGFAFVELTDADAVARAIEELDGREVGGRALRVNEAIDRPPRPSFGGGGRDSRGPRRSRPKGSRRNVRGKKRSL